MDDKYGYWCSNETHNENSIVFWQGDISSFPFMVSHILIKWAYAPQYFSIHVAFNDNEFKEIIPWRKCALGEVSQQWKESFWWWKWKDRSFIEIVELPEKISIKSIRILMKKPVLDFFGIYNVRAFVKKHNVMMRTIINDEDYCLVGQNYSNENAFLLNCIESVSFLNNSEIFKISKNNNIMTITDKKCLTYSEKTQNIYFSHCKSKDSEHNVWDVLSNDSFITLKGNSNKCLKSAEQFYLKSDDVYLKVTSTMDDNQHNPITSFQAENDYFWASNPGDIDVRFIIRFNQTPVDFIKIKWKYPPKKFTINIFLNEIFWKNELNITNNNELETIVKIDDWITGIKLILYDGDQLFNGKIVYGISDMKIFTKFQKINLFDCNEIQSEGIKWKIEEIEGETNKNVNELKMQQTHLYQTTNQILTLSDNLRNSEKTLKSVIENSQKINDKIQNIMNFYKNYNEKILNFQENFLKNEVCFFLNNKLKIFII